MTKLSLTTTSSIELLTDKILIDDESSRSGKIIFKMIPFLFMMYALYYIYSGFFNDSNINYIEIFIGLLLMCIPVFSFHRNFLRRSNSSEINLLEISQVRLKKMLWESVIDIKLKHNFTRRIVYTNNSDWETLKDYFISKGIKCVG